MAHSNWETELTAEQVAKLVSPKDETISREQASAFMALESGTRPRVYAYVERGQFANQIVAIRSQYHLDQHGENIGACWLSGTTISDLISRA